MTQLGKGRGYRWERDVAALFGGERSNAGPGYDIKLGQTVIEAKARSSSTGMKLLLSWIAQASTYGSDWVLAVRLGFRATRTTFAVMPLERAAMLLKLERDHESRSAAPGS